MMEAVVFDRAVIDRAAMFVRNIWAGYNVAFCILVVPGGRRYIRFRWVEEIQAHVEVDRFEVHEKRIIKFASYG